MAGMIERLYDLAKGIAREREVFATSINSEVATLLRKLARYSDNIWKSTSYTKAAKAIEDLDVPITEIVDLKSIEGIGADISDEITEYLQTGEIKKLEDMEIIEQQSSKRIPIREALERTADFFESAQQQKLEYEVVGSIRRGEDRVKDIDIIVYEKDMEKWREMAQKYDNFRASGKKYIDFVMNGVEINIWSAAEDEFGAVVLFRTGPKSFNVYLAQRAKEQGLVLTPTGLFKDGKRIAKDEKDIFDRLGETWIDPAKR